jgi:hypothetical protein
MMFIPFSFRITIIFFSISCPIFLLSLWILINVMQCRSFFSPWDSMNFVHRWCRYMDLSKIMYICDLMQGTLSVSTCFGHVFPGKHCCTPLSPPFLHRYTNLGVYNCRKRSNRLLIACSDTVQLHSLGNRIHQSLLE